MSRRSGRAKALDEKLDHELPDEQDEVTRCVCGNEEISTINASLQQLLAHEYHINIDTGLFIQCDKCLVWQHGYCVGLFINEDVPDKYWCEECKPDLHRILTDNEDGGARTLYRPVNDARKRLVAVATGEERDTDSEARLEKRRSRRSPPTPDATSLRELDLGVSNRQLRKDRRHGDEQFDEQLQRALRESIADKKDTADELEHEVDESNMDEDSESVKRERAARPKPRPKPKRPAAVRKPAPKELPVLKDELLSQQLRPRYVNDKSTIYELRKRTGAILEWLGRTQMELEDEREAKTLQFAEASADREMVSLFDHNLKLMENLTEKILVWEQKYGKYAP